MTNTQTIDNIYPVILAGGQGTRLWPASLPSVPKQFIRFGKKSLMLSAIERAKEVLTLCAGARKKNNDNINKKSSKEILIVTGESYLPLFPKLLSAELVQAKIDPNDITLIAEPCPRNTAPAIALALRYVLDKDPNAIMLVITADHLIGPNKVFAKDVQNAIALTKSTQTTDATKARKAIGNIVTFGIAPTRPETGYGYIHIGESLTRKNKVIGNKVLAFKEKPDQKTAKQYIKKKTYLWNSGMFCFSVALITKEFCTYCPELYTNLICNSKADIPSNEHAASSKQNIWKKSKTKQFTIYSPDGIDFASLTKQSIDYAIMEYSKQVAVVQANFDWNDIGSWDEATNLLSNTEHEDTHYRINAKNASIYSDIPVGIVGLENIAVIIKNNRALVIKKGEGQAVSEIAKKDQ